MMAAERERSRRPIVAAEVPSLEALGARLRQERSRRGLSRPALACAAELGREHVRRLEAGLRRTRASTLYRLALALTRDAETAQVLAGELARLAGPALAPESAYRERAERRRRRRWAKRRRRAAWRAMREAEARARERKALEAARRLAAARAEYRRMVRGRSGRRQPVRAGAGGRSGRG